MNYHKLFKIALLTLAAVSISACSSTKKNASDMGSSSYMGGNGGVSTMGLGPDDGQSIGGYGTSDAYRLKGGANQIYFFDFDQSNVHEKYIPSLNAQANYVVSHPSARILLTGNTDERGSSEYNIALGNRRALAVQNALKSQGVASQKIRVVSYGSEKPVAQGHDDKAWALNRNVQLIYEAK